MLRFRLLVSFITLFCAPSVGSADHLNIAVASNFTATMRQLGAEFEKASGHSLTLSFGSSGKFYAQISHGAPFHIFLSADQTKPAGLINTGFAVADSQITYAVGAIALWSAKPGVVDSDGTVLRTDSFRKMAIANPLLAPYGAAAVDVLRHLKLESATRPSWVMGENIAQTYQYVSTGNAEIGFVALSQIMAKGRLISGSAWLVPKALYQAINQDAVLLKSARNNAAAKEFMAFLRSKRAEDIITSFGYRVAD